MVINMKFTDEQCDILELMGFNLHPLYREDKCYAIKNNGIVDELIETGFEKNYVVRIRIWYGNSFTKNFQPDESDGARDCFEYEANTSIFVEALKALKSLREEIKNDLRKLLTEI